MYPVWSLDGWDFSQYLVKIVRWRDKCLLQGPYLGPQSPGLLINACTSTKSLGELLPGHQMGPLVKRAGTGWGLKGVGTSGSRGTGGHVSYVDFELHQDFKIFYLDPKSPIKEPLWMDAKLLLFNGSMRRGVLFNHFATVTPLCGLTKLINAV